MSNLTLESEIMHMTRHNNGDHQHDVSTQCYLEIMWGRWHGETLSFNSWWFGRRRQIPTTTAGSLDEGHRLDLTGVRYVGGANNNNAHDIRNESTTRITHLNEAGKTSEKYVVVLLHPGDRLRVSL